MGSDHWIFPPVVVDFGLRILQFQCITSGPLLSKKKIRISDYPIMPFRPCCRKHFFGASDNRVEYPKTPPYILVNVRERFFFFIFLFGVFSYFLFSCYGSYRGSYFLIFGLEECHVHVSSGWSSAGEKKDSHPQITYLWLFLYRLCRVRTLSCFREYVEGRLGGWSETLLSSGDLADSKWDGFSIKYAG